METFYLMHRDERVAAFALYSDTVVGFRADEGQMAHLPFGVRDARSLMSWIGERAIPARRYAHKGNSASRIKFLLSNHSLSLTDNYWTCHTGETKTWEELDIYANSFQATEALDHFAEIETDSDRWGLIPNSSLKGDLDKKWVIGSGGKRLLLKGSRMLNSLQTVSEVLASELYEGCDIEFVKYDLTEVLCNNERKLGCRCENFTSADSEFVPAIDIVSAGKKPNDVSWHSYFLENCRQQGIDARHFLDTMLCIDFLIANNDRHFNNFGILRDPVSLHWQKMAPVFDSGNSLFYGSTANLKLPVGKELLKMPVNSFHRTAGEQLKCVLDRSCVDVSRLPSLGRMEEILRMDKSLSDFDVEQRVRVLRDLRRIFEDFQNGAKVWGYPYRKEPSVTKPMGGF